MAGQIGYWNISEHTNVLLVSRDGGRNWKPIDIGVDESLGDGRYCSFPTSDVAFVAAGTWPTSSMHEQLAGTQLSEKLRVQRTRRALKMRHTMPQQQLHAEDDNAASYVGVVQLSTDGMQTFKRVLSNK